VEAVNDFQSMVAKSPLSPASFHILSAESAARVATAIPSRDSSPHHAHWQACIGFEGDDAVLQRYSSDLSNFAQRCKAENYLLLEDDAARALSTSLRELLATVARSSAFATIFSISTLPAVPADILHLRELAARFSIPSSLFAQASGPLYFALEPATLDDETIAALTRISCEVFGYASAHHGHASILFCPVELKRTTNVWGPAAPDAALMRRVKNAFDPQNIFAPGRFVSEI
jgi:FAD/FMN-containing dehydrogenase